MRLRSPATLEVKFLGVGFLKTDGVTGIMPNNGTLPDDFPYTRFKLIRFNVPAGTEEFAPGISLRLSPFFGSVGVAPNPLAGREASGPPGHHTGNLDNKELVAGSTLYLPVHASGALLSFGDAHALQGDGEVSLTALETSVRGTVQVTVRKGRRLTWPRAETPTHYIAMGLHTDLDEAAQLATREMVDFLVVEKGMDRDDAYILASLAVDLRVTQLVDGTKGVCRDRKSTFHAKGVMRHITVFCLLGLVLGSATARAQSWNTPADRERCPSKWGSGDQRGAGNHMKPETVLRATKLIRSGEVIELGRVLSPSMPLLGTRRFEVHTKRTVMNPGTNRRGSNEEMVLSEIGQVGTQFDGFSHQTIGDSMYNCFKVEETATRSGFTKLGIENVGTLITRGVLINVAALKRADVAGHLRITPQDLQALQRRNGAAAGRRRHHPRGGASSEARTTLRESRAGSQDRRGRVAGAPGFVLVGSDNSAVGVARTSTRSNPHQIMLVINGIHLLENMKLDELAAKQTDEFAFILQPLKIEGGTGSTVAPTAVR